MKVPILVALLLLIARLSTSDALKLGERCNAGGHGSCDAGLECESTCSPSKPICTSVWPTDPKSKADNLPFNKYSWLTTHNSFTMRKDTQVGVSNQADSITAQLNNGVRGLMLDMYDFKNDIWLCHSFGGKCYSITAYQRASVVLKEIQTFLEANPTEIVTIFIEDYVTSPKGLSKVFDAAGLKKYWFPLASMPKNGKDWPLISDMISKNQRLLVFTSKRSKEASEGIAYEWNYVLENQYGNGGLTLEACKSRAESDDMDSKTKSLILMNYFPDLPNRTLSCRLNSAALVDKLNKCHNSSGDRWANYIAVDFYKISTGGAPFATDTANGHMVCGCNNINYCKDNATFGSCIDPPPPPPPSEETPEAVTTSHGPASGAAMSEKRNAGWWLRLGISIAAMIFFA